MNSPSQPAATAQLPGLDHLRTLAIMLVLFCHYRLFAHPPWLNEIANFGWSGVDLFFVLSGYLIAHPLFASVVAGQGVPLRTFYIKRLFRIMPAYWTVLAIYFLIPSVREWSTPAPLWKYLTFTQNLGLNLREHGAFSHAWSLCIEEQFYLIFPLIVLIWSRYAQGHYTQGLKGLYAIPFLFMLGLSARIYSWFHFAKPMLEQEHFRSAWYQWIYYPTYNRLDSLLIGISIAALLQFKPEFKERLTRHSNTILLLGLTILVGAYFLCRNPFNSWASIIGFPLVGIAYGLMVLASIMPSCVLARFKTSITAHIATLSYPIYLIHKIIFNISQKELKKFNINTESNWVFLICLIITFLSALILHLLIEKPFLRLRKKLIEIKK